MSYAAYTVREAAELLGIGKSAIYKAAQTGQFPVPIVKVGGRYVIPRRPLDDLLGLTTEEVTA